MNRPLTLAVVALVFATCSSVLAQETNKDAVFIWGSDGNSFLHHCDETDVEFPTALHQSLIRICDFWVLGIKQGIEMTEKTRVDPLLSQQVPPSPELAKKEAELAKAQAELSKSFGIPPSFSVPDSDTCTPPDVTPDQLRRVVIKWLKDNPAKVTEECALLTYAALQNTYPCPSGVKVTDWAKKATKLGLAKAGPS